MHVDLSNAVWSFLLPEGSEGMFRFRFGGKLWDMKRLPFGWKHSLVICQELLGSPVRDLIPPEGQLIHYLDDFLLIAGDRDTLRGVTGRVASRVQDLGFLVSPKSTLEAFDTPRTRPTATPTAALVVLGLRKLPVGAIGCRRPFLGVPRTGGGLDPPRPWRGLAPPTNLPPAPPPPPPSASPSDANETRMVSMPSGHRHRWSQRQVATSLTQHGMA